MLLTQLISQQQSIYAEVQVQIEALQEKQRQIQAYLQQLGSVESQMVSAVQVMQDAIAQINSVCPDELPAYQALVTGLFSNPTAILESGDNEPNPEPPTEPDVEPVSEVVETVEAVATQVVETVEPVDIQVQVVVESPRETLIEQRTQDIEAMTYAQVKAVLAQLKLNSKGTHPILKLRLAEYYKSLTVSELINLNWDNNQKAA